MAELIQTLNKHCLTFVIKYWLQLCHLAFDRQVARKPLLIGGVKLPGHRPGLPGNAISFYIVPLAPAL